APASAVARPEAVEAPAAGPEPRIEAEPDYYLRPYGRGAEELFPVVVHAPAPVRDVTLTVDASGLSDLARVRAGNMCTERAEGSGVFVCRAESVSGRKQFHAMKIRAAEGAKTGGSGTVRYRVTAAGTAPVRSTSTVRVGDGELVVRPEEPATGVRPGERLTYRPAVLNRGDVEVRRFGITLSGDAGLRFAEEFRNCHYTADSVAPRVRCVIDRPLPPGEAHELSEPFRFTVGDVLSAKLTPSVWAPGDGGSTVAEPESGTAPGGGRTLTVRPVPSTGFPAEGGSHRSALRITTTRQVDVQAVAGPVRGKVGDIVEVKVGIGYGGPGRLRIVGDEMDGSGARLRYTIVPPAGTTLDPNRTEEDEEPWQCAPATRGAAKYTCSVGATELAEGDTATLPFFFRINSRPPAGGVEPGRVTVSGDVLERDPEPDNNSAHIRLEVTGTGGDAVPDSYVTESDGESGGGGAPMSDTALGVLAVLAVLVGAAGLLIAVVLVRRAR
ncbi:hypothetical protein, partial [Streptomyces sparsus]